MLPNKNKKMCLILNSVYFNGPTIIYFSTNVLPLTLGTSLLRSHAKRELGRLNKRRCDWWQPKLFRPFKNQHAGNQLAKRRGDGGHFKINDSKIVYC